MQRFINNFSTTVAATFGITDTQLSVANASGFPALGAGDFVYLTVYRVTGVVEREHEVIKITALNNNIFTCQRAVEGAAASQFLAGDRVGARVTAGSLQAKASVEDLSAALTTLALKANSTDVTAAIAQAKADLVNSAPAVLDTLKELSDALGSDANFAATTATSLGNRVRVDTAAQGLTALQKTNAKTNLVLENVDNTTDATKPVSAAQAAAINAITRTSLGVNNVDNTSDANKPVSTAQATANGLKLDKAGGVLTGPLTGTSITAPNITSTTLATLQRLLVQQFLEAKTVITANVSGAVALDLATKGSFKVLLQASPVTLQFTGAPAGTDIFGFGVMVVNDATAGRSLVFPTCKWPNGAMPVRSTAANAVDWWYFWTEDGGTTFHGTLQQQDSK